MNTSNDAKCNNAVSKYREVYVEGKKAFTAGADSDTNPYNGSGKVNSDKRLAWYCGYFDNKYDGRLAYYDKRIEERRTHENGGNNSSS